ARSDASGKRRRRGPWRGESRDRPTFIPPAAGLRSSDLERAPAVGTSVDLELADGPNLDRTGPCGRDPGRDPQRLVEVARIDQVESRELFLGLGERTVDDRHLAVADAHGRRGLDRLERFSPKPMPFLGDRGTELRAL